MRTIVLGILLAALLLVVSPTSRAQQFPAMPDVMKDYSFAILNLVDCRSPEFGLGLRVKRIAYERADGSTSTDPAYPLLAWYLDEVRLGPFLVIFFDSKKVGKEAFISYWTDLNRDGRAEDYGDLARFLEKWPAENVCLIAQQVK